MIFQLTVQPYCLRSKHKKRFLPMMCTDTYAPSLLSTHSFDDVPCALLSVVHSKCVTRSQFQLLQVQSQGPGVLRVQGPHTVQSRAPDGRRGEGPIEGLEKSSTGPLDGSGRHHLPVSLSLLSIHLRLLLLLIPQQRPQIRLIVGTPVSI